METLEQKFNAICYLLSEGVVFSITEDAGLEDINLAFHQLAEGDRVMFNTMYSDSANMENAYFDVLVLFRGEYAREAVWKLDVETIWYRLLPYCTRAYIMGAKCV